MNTLNYIDRDIDEVITEFCKLIEESDLEDDASDYMIQTNDLELQGVLLEIIDKEELDHRIELGGIIYVTI